MRQTFDEGVRACKREVLAAFRKTVLSTRNARYLSVSEKSAMVGCLLEYIDAVYGYIERKDQ